MTRTAPGLARTLLAAALLLALASTPGRQIFLSATTWVGQILGQVVVHAVDHRGTATSGASRGSVR